LFKAVSNLADLDITNDIIMYLFGDGVLIKLLQNPKKNPQGKYRTYDELNEKCRGGRVKFKSNIGR
jgi:hypothetical protein